MGKLRLYIDRMSQPSRAVLIFCLVNKIDVEIHLVNVQKGQHRSAEYQSINPMCQVPAIDDGGFKLFESHAILKYLACTYPGVADHWYPSDVTRRAQIDCVLDWHHANLRRGSMSLVLNRAIGPALGLPLDPKAASEGEKLLKFSLSKLETIWLKDNGSFLIGGSQPSIADISLACEVMQLQLLGERDVSSLLGSRKKLQRWIDAVEKATSPHFAKVHELLFKAAKIYQQKRDQEKKPEDTDSDSLSRGPNFTAKL